jgi:type IV pilus assembly protein PilM
LGVFGGATDFVGIDVGSTAVRLVQLRKSGGKYSLVAFGSAQLPPNIAQSDSKLDMQAVAQIIKQLVKSSKISTKNVVASLSGSSIFSTVVKLPPMDKSEIDKAVKYQAEQNIPLKIEDVRYDWQIVRENPLTKEVAVMIVAAPKARTDRVIELFEMSELDVIYLETNPIAVSRALVSSKEPLVMVVDLGASSTELTIVENGVVSHVRTLTAAGYALTRVIAQNLGLDAAQAEQFKRKFGLSQDKLEGQVFRTMKPILNNITDEIQRSIKFYQEQYGSNVSKIILTGGGSRLPEVSSYLKSVLNLEVVYGNPWTNISYHPEVAERLNQGALEFACAVGLAMREN